MSYDPTVGRWVEQDPAGYIDGPNMYQMELSNPVSLLDPSGLSVTITGEDFNENSIIVDLPDEGHVALADGIEGIVSVYADYDATYLNDGQPGTVDRGIVVKLTARKGCLDYHWLQFATRTRETADGTKVGGIYYTGVKYEKYGETHVDSSSLTSAYNTHGVVEYTDTAHGSIDAPGVLNSPEDTVLKITKQTVVVDDFLVGDGGKVYYEVHWERVGYADGTSEYLNVGGDPINKLPQWARARKLINGYANLEGKVPLIPFTNPVAP